VVLVKHSEHFILLDSKDKPGTCTQVNRLAG